LTQTKSIHGVAVAPGLAMGPVHVIRAAPEVVPNWSLRENEIDSEIARLKGAINTVSEGLQTTREKLLETGVSDKEAEIFGVHQMILTDPSALNRVRERISKERLNAESCVQHLIKSLEASTSAMAAPSRRSSVRISTALTKATGFRHSVAGRIMRCPTVPVS
jgi:phosphotransferase system enzyme I (PtsI)